ncbi:MAG: IS66 family transposase [Candidatus Rokubacteria bacterium]|nr:IS66 family transposase [Candidatus Rokubacteria bacterium]
MAEEKSNEQRLHDLENRLRSLEAHRMRLERENASLREENKILREKVRDLSARLGLCSANSSLPPSSDKPWQRRGSTWKPTGRRPGGQPGHERRVRAPFEPEDIDREVRVLPEECEDCGCRLEAEDLIGEPTVHQTVDIPPVLAEVIQHLLFALRCRGCGHVTRAELPEGVSPGLVGPRLQALMAFLTGRCRISRREAQDFAATVFGEKARLSLGMVAKLEKKTSQALAPAYDDAQYAIQDSPFVNADETGWTEARKPAWLWTAATPLLKVFRIDPRRNREAFRRLLFDFDGILGSDRFSVYRDHEAEQRQLCWAHLLRNFKGLEDLGGKAKRLGVEGQKAVEAIFWWWYRFKDGEITRRGLQRGLAPIRERFRWLLGLHEKSPIGMARKICKDLLLYFEGLWTFARVEGIEPTNNLAERTLRKAVLWRKGSYGSMSEAGSRFAERMLTVCESLRAQDRNVLDFLEESIRAGLCGQPQPSLLPARAS